MTEKIIIQERKRWLTPKDFEEEFGIKENTQSQWRSRGEIPYSKRGSKMVLYDRNLIDRWFEEAAFVTYEDALKRVRIKA
ncbi:MAG: helix-turn-helix domain-containing protein [Campylobacterales bacterium]|nr:helix-turn-helix domain-containing protein [Campylobacterales bacterium]